MKATNRPLTVVALMLSMAMAAFEMTVVSTAMPTVVSDLGGIALYSWVFTAYMLTSTVTVPIYGKLADLYGRKPVILFGIALFLVGSVASGHAQTMQQLIAFRALQGLGAGAMQPIALTIIGDIFVLRERARMQGVFGAVWGVAGLIGPLLGGFIVKVLSWRWVFYINVPLGLAAGLLLALALHENVVRRPHRLDVAGAALLSAAVMALLFAAQGRGSHAMGWLVLAAALLAAFLRVERSAPEPILPLPLFRQRVMAASSAIGALIGGAMIATVTYVPLYVQGVMGGSPTDAGAAIAPMVVGWPIASAVAGRLVPRVGFRPLVRVGLLVFVLVSIVMAASIGPGSSMPSLRVMSTALGVGLGIANTALVIAVQSSVVWEYRGVATASTMFFRTIGSTLAVGAMGGVLAASFRQTSSTRPVPPELVNQLLGPERAHIDPALLQQMSGVLQSGLSTIFWLIASLAVAAAAVGLLFPHVPIEDAPPAASAEALSAE